MSKVKNTKESKERTYQAEMAGLMSLRLIAAPDPKDDPKHSPELIRHLIEFIKQM